MKDFTNTQDMQAGTLYEITGSFDTALVAKKVPSTKLVLPNGESLELTDRLDRFIRFLKVSMYPEVTPLTISTLLEGKENTLEYMQSLLGTKDFDLMDRVNNTIADYKKLLSRDSGSNITEEDLKPMLELLEELYTYEYRTHKSTIIDILTNKLIVRVCYYKVMF